MLNFLKKLFKKKMSKIIVIEGLDGSGKETTTKTLKKSLEESGYKVKIGSFPMYNKWHSFLVKAFLNGKFGKDIKSVSPFIIAIFYAIDRFFGYHFSIKTEIIKDEKKTGKAYDYIIFDRYVTANILYQCVRGKTHIDTIKIMKFIEFLEYTLFRLPKPSKIIALKSTAIQSKESMKSRTALDIYEKDTDYQTIVQQFLDYLIYKHNWLPINTRHLVDGELQWRDTKEIIEEIKLSIKQ